MLYGCAVLAHSYSILLSYCRNKSLKWKRFTVLVHTVAVAFGETSYTSTRSWMISTRPALAA